MPADVVLVNPPSSNKRRMEHLGLGYLAAGLRRAAVRTQIVDAHLRGLGARRVVDLVTEVAPRVVGLTGIQVPPEASTMVAIARRLKQRLPQAHITVGGHFATFCHDRLLRDVPGLDSVVCGEGDVVFVDLVQRLLAGDDWRDVPGVSFVRDGTVVANPPAPLVANLDDLPFPARDNAPVSIARAGRLSMSSSRGCYGRCTFCSISAFYRRQAGSPWRARSAENVVEEVAGLVRDFGCNRFTFIDDNFIGPGARGRERAHAFAHEVLRRGLKIEFAVICRTNDVERDVLTHLREAGLRLVEIGIESGSQRQLERFRKFTTVEQGRRAISILRELGIKPCVYLVMLDPESTLDECLDTMRFVASEGVIRNTLGFEFIAYPSDGTELCEQLRQQRRLRGSYLKGYSYTFRDPVLGLCAKAIRPLGVLLHTMENPFLHRRGADWMREQRAGARQVK